MKRKKILAVAALIMLNFLSGCGTLMNFRPEKGMVSQFREHFPQPKSIYGGVRFWKQELTDHPLTWENFRREKSFPIEDHSWTLVLRGFEDIWELSSIPLVYFFVGTDLCLSAAGDTLTLPLTIPATINRQRENEKNEQVAN